MRGNRVGHALIAAIDILLGHIVEWDVTVIIFQVIESPFRPSLEVLRFVAVGAGVTCAGLIACVAVRRGRDSQFFNLGCEVLETVGPFLGVLRESDKYLTIEQRTNLRLICHLCCDS